MKLQLKGQGYYLTPKLYENINHFIKDAFNGDFNMVIEEFPFYNKLTPRMQTDLVQLVFEDFINNFDHFFNKCENGFRNEFIINMYARRYKNNEDVIWHGQKFEEIFFILNGTVDMYSIEHKHFMILPPKAVFGDYGILFNLKSNIIFKTQSGEQ